MRPFRWVVLVALLAYTSCDVGTAAVLFSKDKSGGDDGGAPLEAPWPEYRTFVAWVDLAEADAVRAELIASKGNPSGPRWSQVAQAAATAEFDPVAVPTAINTILTQVSAAQNYRVDSLEVLDVQGQVVEHASGTVWSNLVTDPDKILGTPDGDGAVTTAVQGTNAFLFTRYAGPIDRFRVSARAEGGLPAGGDIMAVGGYSGGADQMPGGMAINTDGIIHMTLGVGQTIQLVRYGLDAAFQDEVQIDGGPKASAGSHCVGVDSASQIYVAATIFDGRVVASRFQPNLTLGWQYTFPTSPAKGLDRVGPNGIAVDDSLDIVIAGGMGSPQGLNHWLAKLTKGNGGVVFDYRPSGNGDTYWRGVTTGTDNRIYTTGDHLSGLLGIVQILTGRFLANGQPEWEHSFPDNDTPDDGGHAVAVDAANNIFMGGFLGTATEGRNAILVRYGSSGLLSALTTYNGLVNGDDEILDIALDSDGSIYAVGYETTPDQAKNWWVRKYNANLAPVWTRTHDGGVGDDQAISVAIHGNQVVVAGYETVTGGQTKLALRVYAK